MTHDEAPPPELSRRRFVTIAAGSAACWILTACGPRRLYDVPKEKLRASLDELERRYSATYGTAVTVADTRNYVTALIAIDPEELEEWAGQTGNAADPKSEAVSKAVQDHVDTVNQTLASYETVKYFTIVPPMTVEDGLLTASLKVKRKVVYDRYAADIDAMYQKKRPTA